MPCPALLVFCGWVRRYPYWGRGGSSLRSATHDGVEIIVSLIWFRDSFEKAGHVVEDPLGCGVELFVLAPVFAEGEGYGGGEGVSTVRLVDVEVFAPCGVYGGEGGGVVGVPVEGHESDSA